MEKAAEKLSMSQKEIEKFLQKDDKRKDEYYRRFTGEEWKDATQYDLCLDSSKLGYEKCIEEIENQLKLLKNNRLCHIEAYDGKTKERALVILKEIASAF